jgi:hypothetical protein
MRFSSGAPTTPTTTTSIDLIENAQGKRGSNPGSMPPAPIQIVEVENVQQQQHLNGGTAHQDDEPVQQPQTPPVSDKVQQSIAVAITSPPYGGSDGSQTLPDDDGNV